MPRCEHNSMRHSERPGTPTRSRRATPNKVAAAGATPATGQRLRTQPSTQPITQPSTQPVTQPVTRIRAVAPRWSPEEQQELRELRALYAKAAADIALVAACRLQRAQRRHVVSELGELAQLAGRLHAALVIQRRTRRGHTAVAVARARREVLSCVLRIQCAARGRIAREGAASAEPAARPPFRTTLGPGSASIAQLTAASAVRSPWSALFVRAQRWEGCTNTTPCTTRCSASPPCASDESALPASGHRPHSYSSTRFRISFMSSASESHYTLENTTGAPQPGARGPSALPEGPRTAELHTRTNAAIHPAGDGTRASSARNLMQPLQRRHDSARVATPLRTRRLPPFSPRRHVAIPRPPRTNGLGLHRRGLLIIRSSAIGAGARRDAGAGGGRGAAGRSRTQPHYQQITNHANTTQNHNSNQSRSEADARAARSLSQSRSISTRARDPPHTYMGLTQSKLDDMQYTVYSVCNFNTGCTLYIVFAHPHRREHKRAKSAIIVLIELLHNTRRTMATTATTTIGYNKHSNNKPGAPMHPLKTTVNHQPSARKRKITHLNTRALVLKDNLSRDPSDAGGGCLERSRPDNVWE